MDHFFTASNTLYPDDPFDDFFMFTGNPQFNSNTQPKQAGYNFSSAAAIRDQRTAYTSSAATPIPSFNLSTAFDHLNPPGARNFHEFSRSATEAPSHQTSRLCDSLELTAGSGTGIPSSPKHIVLGACLAQGGHPAKHTPRVAVEPIKRVRRVRANDRERKRMKSLNRALESLKKCIPVPQSKRRVTKLEVLRIACSYIRSLSETLNDESDSNAFFRNLGASDAVVNGFSVAQRLEILSGTGAPRI